MKNKKLKISVFILSMFLPLFHVYAGNIIDPHKYVWSNNAGYINFDHVIVNDTFLSGYAWSTDKGLINFSPVQGGVYNDGAGNLSGFAWGEQFGWIDFGNVRIDANGKFSGTATGPIVGTITFDCPAYCDVETDWRPIINPPVIPLLVVPPIVISYINNQKNILPNIPNVSNQISNATLTGVPFGDLIINNPTQSSRVAEGSIVVPVVSLPVQNPALFDVISEPIQLKQQNPIAFIILLTSLEILFILFVLFLLRKIRTRMVKKINMITDKNNNQNDQQN